MAVGEKLTADGAVLSGGKDVPQLSVSENGAFAWMLEIASDDGLIVGKPVMLTGELELPTAWSGKLYSFGDTSTLLRRRLSGCDPKDKECVSVPEP